MWMHRLEVPELLHMKRSHTLSTGPGFCSWALPGLYPFSTTLFSSPPVPAPTQAALSSFRPEAIAGCPLVAPSQLEIYSLSMVLPAARLGSSLTQGWFFPLVLEKKRPLSSTLCLLIAIAHLCWWDILCSLSALWVSLACLPEWFIAPQHF